MSQAKSTPPFWKQVRRSMISNLPERPAEMSPLTAIDDDDDTAFSSSSVSPARSDGEPASVTSTTFRFVTSKLPPSRWCGISGPRMEKDDLRRRVVIPERLLAAMGESVKSRDITVAVDAARYEGWEDDEAPQSPLVVFVNSRSGGRSGPFLKSRLQKLIGEDQVLDLSVMKPSDFVEYSLACLERLAYLGDDCAKATRENMRVMVAGGDGTVGWVLGSLGQLSVENRQPTPPIGIIPLGTGNDLSRSFGWGGSFPFQWRSAVKRSIYKIINGPIYRLDSWHIIVSVAEGDLVELPHSLRHIGEKEVTLDGEIEGMLPDKTFCFEGVFYNYFSIGMDAQVAYSFHHLRDEKPYLAQGPISNKLIYTGYSCKQGWFFTPCMSDPTLRGLKNILHLSIKKSNSSKWEQILVPSNVRAIVVLNLHNYGSGRNPWGNLKPEYLEKKGFVEAHMDDGLLEIFGLKQGWHASLVMVELTSAKHIAQASAIRLEIIGGDWKDAYMQMDGEPWKQPLNCDYSSIVEINRVPYQSFIVNGE